MAITTNLRNFVNFLFLWILAPCRLLGTRQRFGEHTVSIFRAEVAMLGSGENLYRVRGREVCGSGPIRDLAMESHQLVKLLY
jgi:hypothetical protein